MIMNRKWGKVSVTLGCLQLTSLTPYRFFQTFHVRLIVAHARLRRHRPVQRSQALQIIRYADPHRQHLFQRPDSQFPMTICVLPGLILLPITADIHLA
jgi:hypothetical protein